VIYIDSTTGIDEAATFTVGSSYDVVGVLSRYNDLFELKPRQASDITAN
jgi:DNA/RNA endonuclease YhcR with UshA esterase domain